MKKILFVCTGNICRSPLAEAVFNSLCTACGLSGRYLAESRGTRAYHIGEHADIRTRKSAAAHGLEFRHKARKFEIADFHDFDLVLAMGNDHWQELTSLATSAAEKAKVRLFRLYDTIGVHDGVIPDVPDPYYHGNAAFEQVWTIVERTCRNLISALEHDGHDENPV